MTELDNTGGGPCGNSRSSWIESFCEYTAHLPTPEIFQRWSAIATVAGALERKVWCRIYPGLDTYPNMYIVLVADPGVGKTVLTNEVNKFWQSLGTHKVAASSVTAASLGDELRDAQRDIIRPNCVPVTESFNSLLIASDELSVFLPAYENDFMSKLVTLYDCNPYSERRRTKSENSYRLEKPQLHMLAATQPSYLQNLMPEGAWDQGFAARVIFVYSGEFIRKPLFGNVEVTNEGLRKRLAAELKHISKLAGKITFSEEAADALSRWHMAEGPPIPDHPKLKHYCTRRTLQLAKLCMIAAVDSSNSLIITLENFQQALSWLVEAESFMPDIFKSMRQGGDAKAMEDVWYFAYQLYSKSKEAIPEWKLVRFLQERTPAHNVQRILDTMVKAELFKTSQIKSVGKCYAPQARQA